MSLLKSIAKIGLTPAAAVSKQILKVVKPSSSIANQSISKTTEQLSSTAFGKVLGTVTTVTAAALVGASGVVSKVLPSTKSKVIAAVATPAAVTYFADKPQDIVGIPVSTAKFSSAVGSVLGNPSVSGVKDLIKENPVASSLVLGAAALTIGKGTAGLVASVANTAAIRANTASSGVQTLELPSSTTSGGIIGTEPETLETNTQGVQTQATQSLNTPKRRRTAKKSKQPIMSQRVNVIVSNRNIGNKRYLNYAQHIV